MAGEPRVIFAYIVDTLLPSIDGTTVTMPGDGDVRSYTFDLSGAGRIVFDRPPAAGPELVDGGEPVVYVFPASPTLTLAADAPGTLYEYALTLRVGIAGYVTPQDVSGEGDTARGRVMRALDLMEDLQNAIQADRSLGGNVFDVVPLWGEVPGALVNAPAYGVIDGLLTITTART